MKITPLSASIACEVCGHGAPFFGDVDFAQIGDAPVKESGIPIAYYRCSHCEFLFTNALDAWSAEDYAREIYNDDYDKTDGDFAGDRPLDCAKLLSTMLAPRKGSIRLMDYGGGTGIFARRMVPRRGSIRLLDYGGGAGVFARWMNELGFDAASYDPFYKGRLEPRLGEKFELIHCREVIEHTPQPRDFVFDLVRFLAPDGAVYMSTELQPPNIFDIGLRWAYAAPRNGHISLSTRESLAMLWQDLGLNFGSFDANHHAWRGNPACYTCLVKE